MAACRLADKLDPPPVPRPPPPTPRQQLATPRLMRFEVYGDHPPVCWVRIGVQCDAESHVQ
jgi:hypothetical protein